MAKPLTHGELWQYVGDLLCAGNALADAADAYAADQSGATDPRVGLVQPISVADAERLNAALKAWYEAVKEKSNA